MLRLLAVVTALFLQTLGAHAQEPQLGSRVGDVYEIRSESVWSQNSNDGSSGNSHSRGVLVERVIAMRDTGVELEFDLPENATAEERAREWPFPVRVLRPLRGPLELLNGPELQMRADRWLAAAGLPREACGRWYFTWNAFQIQCDPQSVIQMLAAFDLRAGDLRDGGSYQEPGGRGPAVVRRQTLGPDGTVFVVEIEVDPETVRRERAQADAIALEIVGESPEFRSALQARSAERISGTITITFETDVAGQVRRRTRVTELEIEAPDGSRESQTVTETIERRLVSRVGS